MGRRYPPPPPPFGPRVASYRPTVPDGPEDEFLRVFTFTCAGISAGGLLVTLAKGLLAGPAAVYWAAPAVIGFPVAALLGALAAFAIRNCYRRYAARKPAPLDDPLHDAGIDRPWI